MRTACAHDGAVSFGEVGLEGIDVGCDGDRLCVGSAIVCPVLGMVGGRDVRVKLAGCDVVATGDILTQVA